MRTRVKISTIQNAIMASEQVMKDWINAAIKVGITVLLTEESYTSRASFLDRDVMPTYDLTQGPEQEEKPRFSGRRDGRW